MAEAENPGAMLIGGPCRQMIGPERFGGQIATTISPPAAPSSFSTVPANKLEIAERYLDFFIEESCGHCTPCRVGLVLLKQAVHKVVSGAGEPADLDYMRRLSGVIMQTSRCGLGQAAPNPVLGALQNFRTLYADMVGERKTGLLPTFDLSTAVADAELSVGRLSHYV